MPDREIAEIRAEIDAMYRVILRIFFQPEINNKTT